jgi:hypothetical protein
MTDSREARKLERRIVTSHVFPPIPSRKCDWCAYFDGYEEAGPYGWGETEADAIADLHDETLWLDEIQQEQGQ